MNVWTSKTGPYKLTFLSMGCMWFNALIPNNKENRAIKVSGTEVLCRFFYYYEN